MFLKTHITRYLLTVIAISAFFPSLYAWDSLTSDLDIRCEQADMQLTCHYRQLFAGKIMKVVAKAARQELPVEELSPYAKNISAIFLLVDTSDPGRQDVINKNIKQVQRLVNASTAIHQIGLASFDKKLKILSPIGSSKRQLIASAKNIKAEGRTTELYRNLLLAIEKLSRTDASNKAIYLFSDGMAEDKAYFHADVVKAARRKGIIINSIGFPRSVSLSVALQTLRRLSEETGGKFIEADSNYELNDKYYDNPYRNIDSGKNIIVDLNKLALIDRPVVNAIQLNFTTEIGSLSVDVPISLPVITTTKPLAETTTVSPLVTPTPAIIKRVSISKEPEEINVWLWYGLPIALVILFSIALILVILIYRKQPDKEVFASAVRGQNKPFAYLVTQDEKPVRHPVLSTIWRIGRSRDNELTLDDNSVSRLHAEIQRDNSGNFFIRDMQSLNGVYVNEEQVSEKKLEEGDMIEIGDIYLRFSQYTEDYQPEDKTSVQKTKVPAY